MAASRPSALPWASQALAWLPLLPLLIVGDAQAQVAAGGLGTRVNGSVFGQCRAGSCAVNGGSRAGENLFYRFSMLDTRHGIKNIKVDTRGQTNVFLGVTNPSGAFLNKNLDLSTKSNLFLLSPRGMWLGSGAGITNARDLLLTTAARIKLGGQDFDLFQTTDQGIKNLVAKPFSNDQQLDTPNWGNASLATTGDATIEFAGGQITVDRHLLVNASAGSVVSSGNQASLLQAGSSVRIQAEKLILGKATITAGRPGAWGLIDLRGNSPTQAGQLGWVHLTQSQLNGQQILISGGDIRIDQSRLEAPKGWIQIKASDSPGLKSNLDIAASVLDVAPYSLTDLAMPAIPAAIQVEQANQFTNDSQARISHPQIGLFSDGAMTISGGSVINASLLLARIPEANSDGSNIDWAKIADRSGLAILRSGGQMTIDNTSISADASNNKAGRILLLGEGSPGSGGVSLSNSNLFARQGAGNGEIIISSNDGITINNSTIDTSSNRYPVINGVSSAVLAGDLRPYSFDGGRVRLWNTSKTAPIKVLGGSRILSQYSTSGGGLANPMLNIPENDPSNVGRYGLQDAFSLGYQLGYTGGRINFYSEGGISIVNSQLDTSSGPSNPENIGGSVGLIDYSSAGIELRDAAITSRAGNPLDNKIQDSIAGVIRIAAYANINIDRSFLSVQNNSDQNVLPSFSESYLNIPWLAISSETGQLTISNSSLEAGYPKDKLFRSSEYIGINLSPLGPFTKTAFNPGYFEFKDIFSTAELGTYIISDNNLLISSTFNAYNTTVPLNAITPVQVPVFQEQLRLNPLAINAEAMVQSEVIGEETSADANALMKAQEQSLTTTIGSLGLKSNSGRIRSISELQQKLNQARTLYPLLNAPLIPSQPAAAQQSKDPSAGSRQSISARSYVPAIIHLRRQELLSGHTRITAILLTGNAEPISRSSDVQPGELDGWIRSLQRQLSRRSPPSAAADHAAERLSQALLGPLLPLLRQQGVTALLLEVDRGLQAIPYGALPVDGQPMADHFALTITPSLGLIELDPTAVGQRSDAGRLLLAGASQFSQGLAPLPMVRQELQGLASQQPATILLDEAFTTAALLQQARAEDVNNLHIATHATFMPGQVGVLYTGTDSLSLAELGSRLRSRSSGDPLELLTLSGCLTALGDEQSELGFVGMALQAGARSGLGTLWEVDDTATAAFFIQLYRYLNLGLPKDQALQATHRAFLRGEVRLEGDRLVGPDQLTGASTSTLVSGIPREQQTLYAQGLRHPYYWAGMVLTGSPW